MRLCVHVRVRVRVHARVCLCATADGLVLRHTSPYVTHTREPIPVLTHVHPYSPARAAGSSVAASKASTCFWEVLVPHGEVDALDRSGFVRRGEA